MEPRLQPLIQAREEGKHIWYAGVLSTLRASAPETGGAFGLFDDVLPVGYETPYHIHNNEDEAFYIIDGEAEFVTMGRKVKGTTGTFAFLPRGIAHGFRIVGDKPAHILIWATPSGFENFFGAIGEPAESMTLPAPKPFDMPKLMAAAQQFGLEVLGPLSVGEPAEATAVR